MPPYELVTIELPFHALSRGPIILNATSHSGLVGVVPVVLLSLPICL